MKIYQLEQNMLLSDNRDLSFASDRAETRAITWVSSRYQYSVLQLVVVPTEDVDDLFVQCTQLKRDDQKVGGRVTCLNKRGIAYNGKPFERQISLVRGVAQPLYFGLDLSDCQLGACHCVIRVGAKTIPVSLTVTDDLPKIPKLDEAAASLDRVKWLNSNIARDNEVPHGFHPVGSLGDGVLQLLGKDIQFAAGGFIGQVHSYYNEQGTIEKSPQKELFYKPIQLEVKGEPISWKAPIIRGKKNAALVESVGENDRFLVRVHARVSYEGGIAYQVRLEPKENLLLYDVAVRFCFRACMLSAGLGQQGGLLEERVFLFDESKNQDAVFIGDPDCGARVRFKSNQYEMPFFGEHYQKKPLQMPWDSWANEGLGQIELVKTEEGAELKTSTGRIVLRKGAALQFLFDVHPTPFKPLGLNAHFSKRAVQISHQLNFDRLVGKVRKESAKYVTLSRRSEPMPYLNTPLANMQKLYELATIAHRHNDGLVVPFSSGVVSSFNPDFKAFCDFGDEILYKPPYAALPQPIDIKEVEREGRVENELRYLAMPASRLENYYAETVHFLAKYAHIDGLRLNASHTTKAIAERFYKILNQRRNPYMECEVKCNNNEQSGFASVMNDQAEILPFFERALVQSTLPTDPYFVLTEYSGLPYGLTAEYNGAERASAHFMMLFGMTERLKHAKGHHPKQAASLNRFLEREGIKDGKMTGFWATKGDLWADQDAVFLTYYEMDKKVLAVVYNHADERIKTTISTSPRLGNRLKKTRVPAIGKVQSTKCIRVNEPFTLQPKQGVFVLLHLLEPTE